MGAALPAGSTLLRRPATVLAAHLHQTQRKIGLSKHCFGPRQRGRIGRASRSRTPRDLEPVLANAILELRDGRIVRELDILSGDPSGA